MKKVLIIEDDMLLRTTLMEALQKDAFIVVTAADGVEGLHLALQEKPDLIILDIMLPMMDGMEVLAKVRADEWGKATKIIVVSNLTRDDKLDEAYKYGIDGYLVKANWDLDQVVAKVRQTLEEREPSIV